MLDVCLLGTGGMMPMPGRYLTSLLCRYNGSSLLIDCGEGTQVAIRKAGLSMNPIDTILITHFHGDHISGIAGLLLSMSNADRKEPVTIVGPKGVKRVVDCLRVIAPELPFKIEYIELEGDAEFTLKGYRIKAFKVFHNVVCYAYTINIDRAGRFDAERAKEQGIPLKMWSLLQKGETVSDGERTFTPDMVLGPERKGIKLTYCTDSRPNDKIAKEAENADLFICEGMYGDHEDDHKAKEKKHMTFYEAAELAKRAHVSKMWLTHFSPSMYKPAEYLDAVREIFADTETGKDGKSVELKFEEDE